MSLGTSYERSASGRIICARILENVSAPGNGNWFFLEGQGPVSATLTGTFVGTAKVHVHNARTGQDLGAIATKPIIGDVLTAAGWVYSEASFLWVAVEVLTVTSGTIEAVDVIAGKP